MPHPNFLKTHQEQRLQYLPGQFVSMSHHPLNEEILPSVQPTPPLEQFEAVSPCPVAGSQGAEPDCPGLHPPVRELQRVTMSPLNLLSSAELLQLPQQLLTALCPSPFPSSVGFPWTPQP